MIDEHLARCHSWYREDMYLHRVEDEEEDGVIPDLARATSVKNAYSIEDY